MGCEVLLHAMQCTARSAWAQALHVKGSSLPAQLPRYEQPSLHVRRDNEGSAPALQHEDNSNRPFETVYELAKNSLGEYVVHNCVRLKCMQMVSDMHPLQA